MTDETDLAAEMAEVPGLSGTVGELLRVGEMTGTLGEMCLRGSDMLRLEAEGEVRAALATYLET